MDFYNEIKDDVKDIREKFGYANDGIAFGHFCIEECFKDKIIHVENLDVEGSIVDGANDLGSDAIVINEDDKEIYLFQFKHSQNALIKEKDIEIYGWIIEYILEKTNFRVNSKIKEKIDDLISKYSKDEIKNEWDIIYYFIDNSFSPNIKSMLKSSFSSYKKNKGFKVSYELYDYELMHHQYHDTPILSNTTSLEIHSTPSSYSGTINLQSIDKEMPDEDINVRLLECNVSIKSIKELHDKYSKSLFDLNVRYSKGLSAINKVIKAELEKGQKSNFLFLNNGLYCICKKFDVKNDGKVLDVENIQIINGAQTTTMIGLLNKDKIDELENKYVFMKIIELDSDFIGKEKTRVISEAISTASNKQNAVSDLDFRSNDEIQKYLKKKFEKHGYYYVRKAGDKPTQKEKDLIIISNRDIAKSYLSFFFWIPDLTGGRIGYAFKHYYDDIFNKEDSQIVYKMAFVTNLEKWIAKFNGRYKKDIQFIKDYKGNNLVAYFLCFSALYFAKDELKTYGYGISLNEFMEILKKKDYSVYFENDKFKIDENGLSKYLIKFTSQSYGTFKNFSRNELKDGAKTIRKIYDNIEKSLLFLDI